VSKFIVLLLVTGFLSVSFAFLYQPKRPESRFGRIGRRVRIVGYSYVAAIVLSAAGRLIFGWGT
jgi:cyclic lactone autoinducer peptide